MALLRVDEMTEPPELGRHYLVPSILYPWYGWERYWPIIGPRHADAEIFNFPREHYHVDGRFLTKRERDFAGDYAGRYGGHWWVTVAGTPLSYASEPGGNDKPHPPIEWRRRQCLTPIVPHPGGIAKGFLELRRAFEGRSVPRVDGRLTCPHRGADLSTMQPDDQGIITCPLHGLRISCHEARVVRAEP